MQSTPQPIPFEAPTGYPYLGVSNALLLPYVMKFTYLANLEKFCNVARLMGEPVEGLPCGKAPGGQRRPSRLWSRMWASPPACGNWH